CYFVGLPVLLTDIHRWPADPGRDLVYCAWLDGILLKKFVKSSVFYQRLVYARAPAPECGVIEDSAMLPRTGTAQPKNLDAKIRLTGLQKTKLQNRVHSVPPTVPKTVLKTEEVEWW